jgi:hypothetical protein
MNVATLLFPGQNLPYHVVDYALNWAKENEGSLKVLFILPGKQPYESYSFPDDLDDAEDLTSPSDAKQGIQNILKDETRYIEKRAHACHIPISTEILFNPHLSDILQRIDKSELVFVDKDLDNNSEVMAQFPFSFDDLSDKGIKDLFAVGVYDRYTDVVY